MSDTLIDSLAFEIGSHGHVRLVDVMGTDASIVQAARISYGKGTKSVSEDRGLIRYLMRNRHTTPFEMCEIKLHVRCPMDLWRQWIRHRTASVNEYSTRYSEAIDDKAVTSEWRLQSGTNKQGSDGLISEWPEGYKVEQDGKDWWVACNGQSTACFEQENAPTPSQYLSEIESEGHILAKEIYEERLLFGNAKEQARKDLPLSTYTEAYWKCDLHNLFHFLALRMDKHAQLEIRQYANVIGNEIVAKLFPMAWEAFVDYRLGAMSLTRLDIDAIQRLFALAKPSRNEFILVAADIENKREREECIAKLERLLG
jgi:thymidylate synthase (FAD)